MTAGRMDERAEEGGGDRELDRREQRRRPFKPRLTVASDRLAASMLACKRLSAQFLLSHRTHGFIESCWSR